jgi:lysophospholipase L1-like esterase
MTQPRVWALFGGLWLLIPVVLHLLAFPVRIEAQHHTAQIEFALNRSVQLLPGDCVEVRWRTSNIQAVYLNDDGKIGEHQEIRCGITKFNLRVHFQDSTTETFTLNSVVLLDNPGVQLVLISGLGGWLIAGMLITRRWHRLILKQLLLISGFGIFAVFLALILIEIFLRLFMADVASPLVYTSSRYFFYPNATVGWQLAPNAQFQWNGKCREFSATIQTNSFGFRDKEWQTEKPVGVTRIAFLGDSFVEAAQVAYAETPSQVLQQLLERAYPTRSFEVMNFGVSGYSVGQYLVNYTTSVQQFKPDYVVILLSMIQTERTPEALLSTVVTGAKRPTFRYDAAQQVVFSALTPQDYEQYTAYYATFQTEVFVEDNGLYLLNWWAQRDCRPGTATIEYAAYRRPITPDEEKLMQLNLEVIGRLNAAVAEDGGRLIIVDALEFFGARYGIDAQPLITLLQTFASREGIGYVDLGTRLKTEEQTTAPVIFFYDSHFNQRGYALFGETVFEQIQAPMPP